MVEGDPFFLFNKHKQSACAIILLNTLFPEGLGFRGLTKMQIEIYCLHMVIAWQCQKLARMV